MFADRRLKASDLSPIYIGMQSNMTLGGPPAVLGGDQPVAPSPAAGATRVSTLTISLTYNPALVRVRSMQQGIFTRPGDQTGASSAGLLAALLLEPPQFLPAGITVR